MARKLGLLAVAAAIACLAGCASPRMDADYSQGKHTLLSTLHEGTANLGRPHFCQEYWGGTADLLLPRLGALEPTDPAAPKEPWANYLQESNEGNAVRDSLSRLYDSLCHALNVQPGVRRDPDPNRPKTTPTREQMDIAILALQMEDLLEADRWSGNHSATGAEDWLNLQTDPTGSGQTNALPIPRDKAKAILQKVRDALDMISGGPI